jgi:ketosteroid isomerase-like protein
MKRVSTLALAVLATVLLVHGQTNDRNGRDAKVVQELRNLVQTWDKAYIAGDIAAIEPLLADEFSFVGGANKTQYLASFKSRSPASVVESAVSTDVQVQVYGQTAIVTGLDTITGKSKGERYTTRWLYMDVWVRRSGRWQCVKTYSSLANTK